MKENIIYEVSAGKKTRLFTSYDEALNYVFDYLNNGKVETVTNAIEEHLERINVVNILTNLALSPDVKVLSKDVYDWAIEIIKKENIIEHEGVYPIVKKIRDELDLDYIQALIDSLEELIFSSKESAQAQRNVKKDKRLKK